MTLEDLQPSAVVASLALRFIPSEVEQTLLMDREFCREFGIESESLLSFPGIDAPFRRSILFSAVRQSKPREMSYAPVLDTEQNAWRVYFRVTDKAKWVSLVRKQVKLRLPSSMLLMRRETNLRKKAFKDEIRRVRLDNPSEAMWAEIVSERPLTDVEMSDFLETAAETPKAVHDRLVTSMRAGASDWETLIPRSSEYYLRLIGPREDCKTVNEWIDRTTVDFARSVVAWSQREGLLQLMLRSAHPLLVPNLSKLEVNRVQLARSLDDLLDHGDLISQVGAIEAALAHLHLTPSIASRILRLIDSAFPEEEDRLKARYESLSATIAMVDSELGRVRIFKDEPPFWRRCASIAHASAIERAARRANVSMEAFREFSLSRGAHKFWLLSLIDLRVAPYWTSEKATSEQLEQELLGRVLAAADRRKEEIPEGPLRSVLLDDETSRLRGRAKFLLTILPGPMEGLIAKRLPLPKDIEQSIRDRLGAKKIRHDAFTGLVNCALIFEMPPDLIELGTRGLARNDSLIESEEEIDQLSSVLVGLAQLAAVNRNSALADGVISAVQRYRSVDLDLLSIADSVWIGLTASAAHESFEEWSSCVARFLSTLAYSDLAPEDAEWLHLTIEAILEIEPALWPECAELHAAGAAAAYLD